MANILTDRHASYAPGMVSASMNRFHRASVHSSSPRESPLCFDTNPFDAACGFALDVLRLACPEPVEGLGPYSA